MDEVKCFVPKVFVFVSYCCRGYRGSGMGL
jgi:hypothetical protein